MIMGKFEPKIKVCYYHGKNLVMYMPGMSQGQEVLFEAYQSEWFRIITTLASLRGDDIEHQLEQKLTDIPRVGEFVRHLEPLCVYDLDHECVLLARGIEVDRSQNNEEVQFVYKGQEIGIYQKGGPWVRKGWHWLQRQKSDILRVCFKFFIGLLLYFFLIIPGQLLWKYLMKEKADPLSKAIPSLLVEDRLQTDGYLVIQPDTTFSKFSFSIGQEGFEQTIAAGDTLFPRISGKIRLKGWRGNTFSVREYTFDQVAWVEHVLKKEVGSRQFKALFLQNPLRIVYDGLFEDEVNDSKGFGKIQLMLQRLDSYRVERIALYPERKTGYPCIKEIYLQSNS